MAGETAAPGGDGGGGKYDGPTDYTPPAMLFTRRLGFRLGLLVLVAVVPLFVLGFLTTLRSRRDAIRSAGAEAGRLARITSRSLQEVNTRAVLLLEAVAGSPAVVRGTDAERTAFLKEQLARSPGFADFQLVRADGSVVASAIPADQSKALCDPHVLERVLKTKLPAVGDFEKGPAGPPTVYIARPAGEGLVLGATLTLDWLEQFQGALQLPSGSVLDILNPKGLNLIRLPKAAAGDTGQIHPAPHLLAAPGQGDDMPLVGEDTDGVRRFFGIAPLVTGRTSQDFLLVVGIPEDAVVAPANSALLLSLVISAIVLVVSLVLTQVMAEQLILRRVNGLILATKRLGSVDLADLKARRRVSQDPSELGDLERSFDDMARALEKRAQDLDRRAKDLEDRAK
jgi:hypothetical protein